MTEAFGIKLYAGIFILNQTTIDYWIESLVYTAIVIVVEAWWNWMIYSRKKRRTIMTMHDELRNNVALSWCRSSSQ